MRFIPLGMSLLKEHLSDKLIELLYFWGKCIKHDLSSRAI
jgi:hypothetical protein